METHHSPAMIAVSNLPLVERIDQCLPQTQCTLCSYPRCREYAEAIERGEARINQCPPGGEITIAALAKLLDQPVVELNPDHGQHEPKALAWIREDECIGCKLCIKACPVDCIVGAGKRMHTVIADECTGCKLCIPVCPTDCIDLIRPGITGDDGAQDTPSLWPGFSVRQVTQARFQTDQKLLRIEKLNNARKRRKQVLEREQMQREILAAVKRKSIQRQSSLTKSATSS